MGAAKALKDTNEANKYTCKGRFNQILLNGQNMFPDVKTPTETNVFCSERGWRSKDHKIIKESVKKETPICYSDNPPQRLPVFEQCKTNTKKLCCLIKGTNTLEIHNDNAKPLGDNPLGVELDTTKETIWTLILVWEKFENDCEFSINGAFTFICAKMNKGEKQTVYDVVIEKTGEGHDLDVKYEQYTITPKDRLDSVIDALKLYMNPEYVISITGAGQTYKWKGYPFFAECVVRDSNSNFLPSISVKSQKAKQVHNKFECDHKLLPAIYLEDKLKSEAGKVLYCSKRAWRKADGTFVADFAKEQPYCYTEDPSTAISMFTACANPQHACYVIDNNQLKLYAPGASTYNLGLDLDYYNDKLWILIISYENLEEMAFEIADFPKISIAGKNLGEELEGPPKATVKYVEKGQDGTVFFHKFTIEPKEGDSLIDILDLYEKKHYPISLHFKEKSLTLGPNEKGITFFKEGCGASQGPVFQPFGTVLTATHEHNKIVCDNPKHAIFVNSEKFEGRTVYCSMKGWRDAQRKFIKDFVGTEPYAFCTYLCSEKAFIMEGSKKPQETAVDSSVFQCVKGIASVKVNKEIYYDAVKCVDNQWSGVSGSETTLIPVVYDKEMGLKSYQFGVECFGAFLFHENNCNTDPLKAKWYCDQPKLDHDKVLSCADGYVLTYEKKIYKSLTLEKGNWMDGATEIGKADKSKIPRCLSKAHPKNIDMTVANDEWERAVKYTWVHTNNLGTIKCDDVTDIIMFCDDPNGACTSNIGPYEYDAKNKDPAKLKVKAYCYKACDEKKIEPGCKEDPEKCNEYKYDKFKLSCEGHEVKLFAFGGGIPVEQPKTLECTAEGWKEELGSGTIIHSHVIENKAEATVRCVEKCAKRFRKGDAYTVQYEDDVMKCAGTEMIRYTVANVPVDTLEDLKCDKKDGFKGQKSGVKLIDFNTGYEFKAECTPSCTAEWIVEDCTGRLGCTKPTLNPDSTLNENEIKCNDGSVLHYRDPTPSVKKLEYEKITCSKESFTSVKSSINLVRKDVNMKIAVECISKCDKQFVTMGDSSLIITEDGTATPGDFEKPSDGKHLKCLKDRHYTMLKVGNVPYYTNGQFDCHPTTGWEATDIQDEEVLKALKFNGENHVSSATAGCFDYCKDRFENTCTDNTICKEPIYDDVNKQITCGDEHTMSKGDGKNSEDDFIDETLKCDSDGLKRKAKNDELVFKFDNSKVEDKFKMHCFSNCKTDLVTFEPSVSSFSGTPQPTLTDLKCKDDEPQLLVIESASVKDMRVFHSAKCTANSGWSGVVPKMEPASTPGAPPVQSTPISTEDKQFINFKEEVRITATCYKVCSKAIIEDCTAESEESKEDACQEKKSYESNVLKCPKDNRLFHKQEVGYVEMETGELKCSSEGWKDGAKLVVDFKDIAVDYKQQINFMCKHKCNQVFVKQSCKEVSGKKTCEDADYKQGERILTCNHPSEVLVFDYTGFDAAGNPIEMVTESIPKGGSLASATCSNEGWTMGDEKTLIEFKNPKYFEIKVRCEQVCSPNVLTEENKSSRDYKLDETLTCKDVDEKLIFEGNDWYSDLNCTVEGWKTTLEGTHDEKKLEFKPQRDKKKAEYKERSYKAECVKSACYRDIATVNFCAHESTNDCDKPDFKTLKYYASCKFPSKIMRATSLGESNPITADILKCDTKKDDNTIVDGWFPNNDTKVVPFLNKDGPMNLICYAGECARCKKDVFAILPVGVDLNNEIPSYKEGSASYCSHYYCPEGKSSAFKLQTGSSFTYYYVGDDGKNNKIKCVKDELFLVPDGTTYVTSAIGCVKQIPCIEHSPINTFCDPKFTVQCDDAALNKSLADGSKIAPTSTLPAAVNCPIGKLFFLKDGVNDWVEITLKCKKNGRWGATETNTEIELENKARVVCADQNPKTIVTTTTPKPGMCAECKLNALLDSDKFISQAKDDQCIATVKEKEGRWSLNADHKNHKTLEPTDSIVCTLGKDGKYVWRAKDGTVIKSLAITQTLADKMLKGGMHPGIIAGIVIAVICILGGVAGLLVFMRIRKQKEAARLETLKSKGLETKNDSIIDQIEVDNPKTLIL